MRFHACLIALAAIVFSSVSAANARDRALVVGVDHYPGIVVLDEPHKVRALLADLCASQSAQRYIITAALEQGVPSQLRSYADITSGHALDRISVQLRTDTGFGEPESRWAVESIAFAMGLLSIEHLNILAHDAASRAHHQEATSNAITTTGLQVHPDQQRSISPPVVTNPIPPPLVWKPTQVTPPLAPPISKLPPTAKIKPRRSRRSTGDVVGGFWAGLLIWWLGCIALYFVLTVIGRVTGLADHDPKIMAVTYITAYVFLAVFMIVRAFRGD